MVFIPLVNTPMSSPAFSEKVSFWDSVQPSIRRLVTCLVASNFDLKESGFLVESVKSRGLGV